MSSTHTLPSSSSSEPKKKFGKNLNKLTKPPPPPTSSASSAAPSSRGGSSLSSSRNGLLLLSTKRTNSLSSSSGVGGSLLAPKPKVTPSSSSSASASVGTAAPKPLNTPSLRSESSSSHDALLTSSNTTNGGAVAGWGVSNGDGSSSAPSAPSQQSAWGLGDKASQPTTTLSNVSSSTAPILAPKGGVSAGYYSSHPPLKKSQSSSRSYEKDDVDNHDLAPNNATVNNFRRQTNNKPAGSSWGVGNSDDIGKVVSDSAKSNPAFSLQGQPQQSRGLSLTASGTTVGSGEGNGGVGISRNGIHSTTFPSLPPLQHDHQDNSPSTSIQRCDNIVPPRTEGLSLPSFNRGVDDYRSSSHQPHRSDRINVNEISVSREGGEGGILLDELSRKDRISPPPNGYNGEPKEYNLKYDSSSLFDSGRESDVKSSQQHELPQQHQQQQRSNMDTNEENTNGKGVDLSFATKHETQISSSKPNSSDDVYSNAEVPLAVDGKGIDDQVQFMSRLARERAEVRRAEEEARMNEQRERAARRLKELEDKMMGAQPNAHDQSNSTGSAANHPPPPQVGSWRQQTNKTAKSTAAASSGSQQSSEIVLELLGRPKQGSNSSKINTVAGTSSSPDQASGHIASGRALIDPGRTYSSLVGGSKAPRNTDNEESRGFKQPTGNTQQQQLQATASFPPATHSHPPPLTHFSHKDPHHAFHGGRDSGTDEQPPVPVIHLSSYEDRDRGERNSSSGPRMLFDPKSGSMIEAPPLDKRGHHYADDGNVGGKGRKERSKQKSRSARERDGKDRQNDIAPPTLIRRPDTGPDDASGRRKNSSDDADGTAESKMPRRQRRKDEVPTQRKDRQKRLDREPKVNAANIDNTDAPATTSGSSNSYNDGESFATPSSTANKRYGSRGASSGRQQSTEPSRMPRTRGVLYKMDVKGNYVCADGCEADQGYGAHSVPGGRVRNPTAHAQFLEQQQKQQQQALYEKSAGRKASGFNNRTGEKHQQYVNHSNGIASPNMNAGQIQQNLIKRGQKRDPQQRKERQQQQIDIDGLSPNGNSHFENNQLLFPPDLALSPNRVHEQGQNQFELSYSIPSPLRVKANEDLSILTGVPESPELQATANPWAPSEAALAAAAAVAASAVPSHSADVRTPPMDQSSSGHVSSDIMNVIGDSGSNDDDRDFNSSPSIIGLGFDPTENMDLVMMSPSLRSEATEDEVPINLTSLSLDATSTAEPSGGAISPFAPLRTPNRFLGSSTWATGGSLTRSPGATALGSMSMGSVNWSMLGTSKGETTSSTNHASTGNTQTKPATPATFLSLSPLSVNHDSNTWGSGGFGGGLTDLGGTALSSSPKPPPGQNAE